MMAEDPVDRARTPEIPEYFDYLGVAEEAGITREQLRSIIRLFEADYPTDVMLRELHILRACRSVKDGRTSVETLIRAAPPASAA